MADDRPQDEEPTAAPEPTEEGDGAAPELTAEQRAELEKVRRALLAGDRIESLSEEEIRARLSATDSGDVLGHDEVVAGLSNELSAQQRVIGLLSDQREPEGVNIAKVLDSSAVDIGLIMDIAVTDPTKDIIGPAAPRASRVAIRQAINLPNGTAFKMCLSSILIRIGRVAITASGIFLGIAFYASVAITNSVLRVVATQAGPEALAEAAQDHARQIWLIFMALLVAVFGICNSMLMAVAERFQEIGTMKCLGALDGFIVKLFLIESGLLGLLAGFTGGIVGMGLMYVANTFRYEFKFLQVAPDMVKIIVYSVVMGTVLSVVAAILPARQAAKMPAAAALRTAV